MINTPHMTGTYVDAFADGKPVRAFIPESMPPADLVPMEGDMLTLFSEATLAVGGLNRVTYLLPDAAIFLYSYVRKESLLSSQIEGTHSTLSEFLEHELAGAAGVPNDDVLEVSNHVAALQHGLDRLNSDFPISNRLIREMHSILLRRGRGSNRSPGEFRLSQVWLGGRDPQRASFVPPPANYVESLMGDLELFIHSKDPDIPPLLRAGYAHVQFETIHPFGDGNGRIGRILITTILLAAKILDEPLLYLSLYFKNHRSDYYRLLNSVRLTGSWNDWIEFFLEGVRETALGATETATRLRAMFDADRQTVQQLGRRAGSALRIHEAFMKRPLLTAAQAAEMADVTFPTANTAISILVDLGLAEEITGRGTNRVYKYTQYLDVLSEGTEPL